MRADLEALRADLPGTAVVVDPDVVEGGALHESSDDEGGARRRPLWHCVPLVRAYRSPMLTK
jgi:hypothetical protein